MFVSNAKFKSIDILDLFFLRIPSELEFFRVLPRVRASLKVFPYYLAATFTALSIVYLDNLIYLFYY